MVYKRKSAYTMKSSIDNSANGNEQTLKSSKLLFFQKQERALEIINELFQENILNSRQRILLQGFAEKISGFKIFEVKAIQ